MIDVKCKNVKTVTLYIFGLLSVHGLYFSEYFYSHDFIFVKNNI